MPAFNSYSNIYRTKELLGKRIPGIIRNGSYFFTNLEVYEDGRIECWGLEDLETFRDKLNKGWVQVSIPDDEAISIHGLGDWKITDGNWSYSSETFYEYILSLVKDLNPEMQNLHKKIERRKNGILIGESGGGRIYKEEDTSKFFPTKIKGEGISIFFQIENGHYFLAQLNVFANGQIEITHIPEPVSVDYSSLSQLVIEGKLASQIPNGSAVEIYGLGSFTIKEEEYATEIQDKLLEIKDLIEELNDRPDSIDICRNILEEYTKNPSIELKEKLKEAYESIPEHQRMFVGDMDTKDIPVRMIIYGDEVIQNWSHYAVAKHMGEPLPIITVPKPKE